MESIFVDMNWSKTITTLREEKNGESWHQKVHCCWNSLPKNKTDRTIGSELTFLFARHCHQEQLFCEMWLLELFMVWPPAQLQLSLSGSISKAQPWPFLIILTIFGYSWVPLRMPFPVPDYCFSLSSSGYFLLTLQDWVAMLAYSVKFMPISPHIMDVSSLGS